MLEGEFNLIQASKRGNAESFGLLYDHYLPQIYRFVYLKIGSKTEAEDLTHDVFLSAWQNMPNYIHQGFPFSSWLYQIARNKIIDHFRTQKISLPLDDVSEQKIELVSESEVDLIDFNLSMDKVRLAMQGLSDDHQNILIMRFIEDMSPHEIAEIIGKTEGAVRLLQHRAIQKLKLLLTSQNPTPTQPL